MYYLLYINHSIFTHFWTVKQTPLGNMPKDLYFLLNKVFNKIIYKDSIMYDSTHITNYAFCDCLDSYDKVHSGLEIRIISLKSGNESTLRSTRCDLSQENRPNILHASPWDATQVTWSVQKSYKHFSSN